MVDEKYLKQHVKSKIWCALFHLCCKGSVWLLASAGIKHAFTFFLCLAAVVPRCLVKKSVLRNFAKFTEKHLSQSLLLTLFVPGVRRSAHPYGKLPGVWVILPQGPVLHWLLIIF